MKNNRKNKLPFFLVLFFVVFISLLPSLASTTLGKNIIIFFIQKSSSQINIESLSLGWFGSQTIQGLSYQDSEKKFTIECPEISISEGLIHFIWKPYKIGQITLQRPLVRIMPQDAVCTTKKTNIQTAAFFNTDLVTLELSKDLFSFDGKISVEQGTLQICGSKITFNSIDCAVNINRSSQEASLSAKANTEQGSLSIVADFQKELTLKILCDKIPLQGPEEILKLFFPQYQGFLLEAVGPFLDLQCSAHIAYNLCDIDLKASAQNFQTSLQIHSKDSIAELASPASCTMTLSPALLQKANLPIAFAQNALTFTLTLDQFQLPFYAQGPAFKDISFNGKVQMQSAPSKTGIAIKVASNFSSLKLSQQVQTDLNIFFTSPSQISLTALAKNIFEKESHLTGSINLQTVSSALLNTFIPSSLTDLLGPTLSGLCNLTGNLEKADINLSLQTPLLTMEKSLFTWEKGTLNLVNPFHVSYRLTPETFTHHFGQKPLTLQKNVNLAVEIMTLSYDDSLKTNTNFSTEPFNFTQGNFPALNGNIAIKTLSDIKMHLESQTLVLDSTVSLQKEGAVLTSPLQVQYKLRDQDIPLSPNRPKLLEDALLQLTITPTTLAFHQPLSSAKLQADLKIDSIKLGNAKQTEKITIQNTQASIKLSGPKDEVSCSFQSEFSQPAKGLINGSCLFPKAFSCNDFSFCSLDLQTEDLPLSIASFFLPSLGPIKLALGEKLTAKARYDKNLKNQSVAITAKTPLLQMSANAIIKQDEIKLVGSPWTLQYQLTPEGYKMLTKAGNFFILREPALFSIKITDIALPLSYTSLQSFLTKLQIQASAENSKATFARINSSDTIALTNSTLSLRKTSTDEGLRFVASTQTQGSSQSSGTLDADVTLTPGKNPEPGFFPIIANAHIQASKLPSSIVDIICQQKKDFFATLLGSSFDSSVDLTMEGNSGKISCDLASPQMQLHCQGKIQEGSLKLLDTAHISLALTPKISQLFFQGAEPLSLRSASAANPVTLSIAASGFSFPLHPPFFNRIEAPFIRINLGKLQCQNEGSIHVALKALKYKQADKKDLELWFAPMDLHIKQGIVDVERTEILIAKTLDLALWGKVDLPKSFVDMTLGITASALKETLKLKNLPEDYVLKIPLQGPLNNVELKTGSATAKITGLLLWQSDMLKGKLGPLGGVLQKVIPPPGGEGKTPPPKTPFPWQTENPSNR